MKNNNTLDRPSDMSFWEKCKIGLMLIRYPNLCIIAVTQALICYRLLPQLVNFSYFPLFLLLAYTMLIAAAGYVVNDIFDVAEDAINKPEKQIVEKKISVKKAWHFYFSLLFAAFFAAFSLSYLSENQWFIWIFFLTNSSLFLYAKYLKKSFLLGNAIVSILCALTALMPTVFFSLAETAYNEEDILRFYTIFAFFITFFREIIKDIEDVEGDKIASAWTLPIVAGVPLAKAFASLFLLALIVLLYVFNELKHHNHDGKTLQLSYYYGLFLLIIPCFALLFQLFRAKNKTQFHAISTATKIVMLAGLGYLFFL